MHGRRGPLTPPNHLKRASRASSQVHTLESKWQIPDEPLPRDYSVHPEYAVQPATTQETHFRHSSWAARRRLVWEAYTRLHLNGAKMDRFHACGSGLWLQRSASGDELRLSCNCCHDRLCIPCQISRGTRISKKIAALIQQQTTRFLTLTLRHNSTPLRDQIDRLYACFLLLRRRTFWKDNVRGGAAFLEIKVSEFDGLWHPHLHIVISGRWMDARQISSEWLAVTGDSSIVKIKSINDAQSTAAYITKYVTKVIDHSVFIQPDKLDECILALRGRRLFFPIGDWRGKKIDAIPKDETVWVNVGDLYTLRRAAQENSEDARRWIDAALRKWPTLQPFLLANTPDG